MLQVPGRGSRTSRIIIVGEAPGADEELSRMPFVGTSGKELDKLLREAGIDRDECYVTNVCQYRPPENEMAKWLTDKKTDVKKLGYKEINGRYAHPLVEEGRLVLLEDIAAIKPDIVVGLGNTPLWALTGNWGVTNWRGSEMKLDLWVDDPHDIEQGRIKRQVRFVPTFHPASVLRNWQTRPQVLHDLKQRVSKRLKQGFVDPSFRFNTNPTFEEVLNLLSTLEGDVCGDIETAAGTTICLGLAWSDRDSLCIPFRHADGVRWSREEIAEMMAMLQKRRSSMNWIGQNWNYDAQYIEEDFKLKLLNDFDTYIAQSVLFPGVERSLGFLSSMYCEWHQYWKEDAKDWGRIADFDGLFTYNCRDCVSNWEVAQIQRKMIQHAKLEKQFSERMKYSRYVYQMMRNGVNRDPERTKKMDSEASEAIHQRELFVAETCGKPVNFNSPKQVADLFYKQLGCKVVKKRGTGKPTTDDEALKKVSEDYPQHAPLALAILESRSLQKLQSTFLRAELDPDGKFRSSWMATGTETFRLTSSGNAFHRGGNLQNVTDGKHTHSGRKLPNLRSTIVPDPGYTIFNCDLERADLQVVAWEADDAQLKDVLKRHGDIHLVNAVELSNLKGVPYDECFPTHPNYEEHKAKFEQPRHFAKTFVHGTNYGGTARTMAIGAKCTVHEADLAQRRWFAAHPGIKAWHQRTQAQLMAFRTVTNRFGYRRIYFDRIDGMLPEALAWLPQSTVSILISLMQMAIEDELADQPDFSMIMQGHDSVIGQYLTTNEGLILPRFHSASKIAIPYPDPLYIPLELSTSLSSWGELEQREWPTHA